MKTIWKEILEISDVIPVMLPKEAEVLTVQMDRSGLPAIWFICDPEAPKERRLFRLYGTGHDAPDILGKYIGTFQMVSGKAVFHLFEV